MIQQARLVFEQWDQCSLDVQEIPPETTALVSLAQKSPALDQGSLVRDNI